MSSPNAIPHRLRAGSPPVTMLVAAILLAVLATGCGRTTPGTDLGGDAGVTTPTPEPAATPTPTPEPTPTPSPEPAPAGPLEGAVIALDPGHNGANAAHPEEINRQVDAGGFEKRCNTVGAETSEGYTESRFAWDLAGELRAQLEAAGAEVHLTRETDDGVGPCIDERGRFAGEVGADLLVSLHADGAPETERGFHVITPGDVPGHTDGLVEPSAELAVAIRDALVDGGHQPSTYAGTDGIHERADIGTLNRADVPAVMVETANMRHPDDAAMLSDPGERAALAGLLRDGLAAYLEASSAR